MIRDAQNQFSAAQALTNGSVLTSTNVIDLALTFSTTTVDQHGFCTTEPMMVYFNWTGTPAGTNLKIEIRSSTTTNPQAATFRTHWSTGIIVAANYATAGIGSGLATTFISLPHGPYNPSLGAAAQGTGFYLQYLGVIYDSTGDNTAGIVTCGLVKAGDMQVLGASGYTVA